MLHRVLPSMKERWCFTIWLSGVVKESKEGGSEKDDVMSVDTTCFGPLIEHKKRTLLAKVTYMFTLCKILPGIHGAGYVSILACRVTATYRRLL